MPTLVGCPWRRVEATQPGRVPTHFGPATRLRRPESQWNQGALATSQVEMCPRTANSGLAEVRSLALGFAALVRKKGTGTLDGWLAAATGTPLEGFAEGLGKDLAAGRAALETPWSTGPVAGQISRLKTIKRTMYGRAGFGLLRSRVLHAA